MSCCIQIQNVTDANNVSHVKSACYDFFCVLSKRKRKGKYVYVNIYIYIFISQLYQFCNQFSSIAFHAICPGNRSNVQAKKWNFVCSSLFFPWILPICFGAKKKVNSIKSIPFQWASIFVYLSVCVFVCMDDSLREN